MPRDPPVTSATFSSNGFGISEQLHKHGQIFAASQAFHESRMLAPPPTMGGGERSIAMKLGNKLMSEEHGPAELVENAVRAEELGFDFVGISDHYAPWISEQGHSPFAWTVLGAIAHATKKVGLMTGVTCPFLRYHPAIVAQAAATTALLAEGRFTLGLGAGELLNEHVVGELWPRVAVRHEMLGE